MKPDRFALGLSVHTGWAACCVVGGDLREPDVAAREIVEMLGDPERFVFHRAAEMKRDRAEQSVASARRDALVAAKESVAALVDRMRAEGRRIARCAIVARHGELPPLDDIVSAHPRIHTAEGTFYRDVLREAAASCAMETRVVAPKELGALAAEAMDVKTAQIATLLAAAGRALGPPWGKDEKTAALAAWTVLAT